MHKVIPVELHWLIEAKVKLAGEFSDSFIAYMLGLGIIPKALATCDIIGDRVGEVKIVSSMHERKVEMLDNADAFIVLPGGLGTLEELFEVATWAQLKIHQKPIGLLNVNGFYDILLSSIDYVVEKSIISPLAQRILVTASTGHQLIEQLEVSVPRYDHETSQQD
ncbi:hypothetical protein Dsin_029292 [Dipteronia sinensis]|uniref:Cytokinin riboside 5'-monophosphate phosphoribohydrolase n=1 Tax=Dipteronia sinensis TaxID=43782 RepID=A0AAE0DVC7_9ROSI|nr:hypothetical protein Dsin_029292 [Dipteronia sinensis]